MSAFQQAMANLNTPSSSGSSLSIRGAAAGAPSTRSLANALRSAGISRDSPGMEVDGGASSGPARSSGGRGRGRGRSSGPMDQSARPSKARNDAPYSRPERPTLERDNRSNGPGPSTRNTDPSKPLSLASRLGRGGAARGSGQSRKAGEGTPPIFRAHSAVEDDRTRKEQASVLSSKLRNESMKDWLRSRVMAPGVMDMSNLPQDEYLKKEDIVAPGHRNASPVVGTVFWRLIDLDVQKALGVQIHTFSLADNGFTDFGPLDKLAYSLPHLRALNLSNNPVKDIRELDILLARGEKKGNAMAGAGSLKSLTELKLDGCAFRETMLQKENGKETYQHEILRRFPGLLMLDGEHLNRIVFPIERKAKVHLPDDVKEQLHSQPFTFPLDVQGGMALPEPFFTIVNDFCARFFSLFDTDRAELLPAYSPTATISAGPNTLRSRSKITALKLEPTRTERPPAAPFTGWTDLPGRNLFRLSTMDQRLRTLKSPVDTADLQEWWARIPATKHPLDDGSKWCVDGFEMYGEDVSTKLCVMIQGEFTELPSGSWRSFSRTFILGNADQGSTAAAAGWQVEILSDTFIVHQYMSTDAFDQNRSLAVDGVSIVPPQLATIPPQLAQSATHPPPPPPPPASAPAPGPGDEQKEAMVAQLRQATGMNAQYATMCMAGNGWDYATARTNFDSIKHTIPPEAFQ